MKKTGFKVGDTVKSNFRHSTGRKIEVVGKVKDIIVEYGYTTFIITNGVAEDFSTRLIRKVK